MKIEKLCSDHFDPEKGGINFIFDVYTIYINYE